MRLKGIEATPEFLGDVLTTGTISDFSERLTVEEGLPEDAEYVYAYVHPYRRTIVLVYYHESFDDLLPGTEIPLLAPIFHKEWREK